MGVLNSNECLATWVMKTMKDCGARTTKNFYFRVPPDFVMPEKAGDMNKGGWDSGLSNPWGTSPTALEGGAQLRKRQATSIAIGTTRANRD